MMNTIGDLVILAASLVMTLVFWRASQRMGRANEGTRIISFGLGAIAVSAFVDATEIFGPVPFAPVIGGPMTEGIAYAGYSLGAVCLAFGLTRWMPLLKRLDKEVAGRARAETNLNRALDVSRRFNAGLEALGKDHIQNRWSEAELMDEATRRLSQLMGVARISVWTRDADGGAIECLSLYARDADQHTKGMRLERDSNPAYFDAIESGSTVSVPDAMTDPITLDFVEGYLGPLNIGAILDAPIRTGDGIRGVVCCEHVGGIRRWSDEEASLASAFAQYIGVAMLAEELKVAAEAARSASRAKSAFLANMSHELRTPLNGMLGMADVIANAASTQTEREAAETLTGAGRQLLAVLNDVLDLSKIEAGRLELRPEPTDIAALVRESCALFRPAAQKKGLSLTMELSALPDAVSADPVRVRQILSNLVANAVKFTDTGSVTVSAGYEPISDGMSHQIVLSVNDTGCGISLEDQGRLFRRFSQVEGDALTEKSGSGLGLVIARELAQKMDGDIRVESEAGKGARFTFTFKAVEVQVVEGITVDESDHDALNGAQILLVDDNAINRMVARCFIEPLGARVTEAGSGEAALKALKEQAFDLVLLDAHMPKMDGLATLAELRALPQGHELPVIVITAEALASDEARYLAAGMDAYIPKPIDKTLLVKTCVERLKGGRSFHEADARSA
ncbi:ATP-binding protein [Maricaulaceae bacterium NA33B04]|nr:ATP-binding protein [Maricaulaceae bacterium NA33B04]